ncbi:MULTISPECIES: DUF6282 family protein [unclassified Diaminobutyricimonas]|uniref:DUF6282 family protein n=1 Tax=unclassified Diaminobutyricimonas TaxID=2643261 RepID=UPI0012F47904|nr:MULTISPECIES: DUF6282 family protein [unclassified Diaminobutyricimonas]
MRPIDFHLHFAPDDRPRKYDGARVIEDYARVGARGVVYKSHQLPTSVGAAILDSAQDRVRVAGGVALNSGVGGLNPAAVEAAAKSGGRLVWLPTQDAASILDSTTRDGSDGFLAQVWPILELCAQYDLVLCSGHLPPAVTMDVFQAAERIGVQRRVVTHPDHFEVGMTVEEQTELARHGAYLERVVPRSRNTPLDLAGLVAQMRAVGTERNVLGSDLGQPDSVDPADGYMQFLGDLTAAGISDDDLATVAELNAAALLGWGDGE